MDPDVTQSLQRWKYAQRQLDDAIQCYVIATKALNTSLSRTTVDPSGFEDAVVKIDQDCTVDSRVAKLYQTQVILRRTRNKSTSCVPINKLPWEILLRILTISIHTIRTTQLIGPTSPSVLQQRMLLNTTHVCALWRKVITHTPSFWSTIYLKYGSNSRLTNMCNQAAVYLGRARTHPLTLQFEGPGAQSRSDIAKIHSRVRPYLKNTTELRFFNIHSREKAKDVLAFWLADGEPGSVEMLSIWTSTRTSGQITLSDLPFSQERIDSFLLPIKRLVLHKVRFEWNSVLFHDLVVLKLTDLDGVHSPRPPDIVNILAKCPKLCNLQLDDLSIIPGELDSSEPILLPELRFLGLHGVSSRGLCLLLPMLAGLSTELGMRMDLYPGTSEAGIAVQTFLSRIGAHKLWIDSTRSADGLVEYFSATPDLTHLILDLNSGPGDTLLDTLVQDVDGEMVPRCPQLQTMILTGGSLQNDSVQRVIRVHPLIEKVRFFACFLEPFEEELMHWIKPLIKDVKSSSRAVWQ